jgi:molecular chaperone DnaK
MPAIRKKVEEIFKKEPNKTVNPDEAVGLGAAIQAGVLGGDVSDITLLDVTPLSLGVETLGGVMTKLIERNTTIPTEKKQVFSTAENNQSAVDIRILQGEREMAEDNRVLGTFRLDGIAPAPRGVPQIEVTFAIDANGILNVKAEDKATGKEQHITITASTSLSDDEIDKMVEEAAKHAKEDKKKKEKAEIRNNADTMIFSTEKLIDDEKVKDKLDESDKKKAKELVDELKELIKEGDDAKKFDQDKVKEKTEELEKVVQEMSKKLYEKAGQEVEQDSASEKKDKDSASSGKKDSDKEEDSKKEEDASDDEEEAQEGEVVDED